MAILGAIMALLYVLFKSPYLLEIWTEIFTDETK
jgi:hypothetical protein